MLAFCVFVNLAPGAMGQDRVEHNGQSLFLSGLNLAWKNFAADVGPGSTDLAHFDGVFGQLESNGANTMRLWLHTNGASTPAWSGNTVTGPGTNTINDLKDILDLAYERRVGLVLCLWSFDMLRTSYGSIINNRANAILTNATHRQSYIDNSLIPMVQALAGHPAIISWEIFNEPEGMSNEFGWSFTQHVPMSDIQAFVNKCAGAIHRTDPTAKVTNGAWSFYSMSDVGSGNFNYYRDDRLIAAGGDPDGTLDFYTVHYYDWAGTERSPFHHDASRWGLTKPLVVAEFYPAPPECVNCGNNAYETLYSRGYAGALAWSWTDSSQSSMLGLIQGMAANHPADVIISRNNPPLASITSPSTGATIPQGTPITITADISDSDGSVAKVEFFKGVTKLGENLSAPWSYEWTVPSPGSHSLTVVATDDDGAVTTSEGVSVTVQASGSVVRLQAEDADYTGVSYLTSATADMGAGIRMENTGSVTWTVPGVPAAGNYSLTFGYRLPYGNKNQNLKINGGSAIDLLFDGVIGSWITKSWSVPLSAGTNTIRIDKSWGYMDFDYIELTLPNPQPDIAILGQGLAISNGDATPRLEDGTSFGSVELSAGPVNHVFTIHNSGDAPLTLTSTTLSEPGGGQFSITGPTSPVAAGGDAPFTVHYDPSTLGSHDATVTILSNDSTNSPYTFSVRGQGFGTPVILVEGLNESDAFTSISNESAAAESLGTVFADTMERDSTSRSFRIRNTGSDTLILGTARSSNGLFTLTPLPSSIGAGGEAGFTVTFLPQTVALHQALIIIPNNDADPFTFFLQGLGIEPPPLDVQFDIASGSVSFLSRNGRSYWVETCENLINWEIAPGTTVINGNGAEKSISIPDAMSGPKRFYRLAEQ